MNATMETLVDLIVEDERWNDTGLGDRAEAAARAVLADLGLEADGFEISLLACDDARMATLNADFRGRPAPTNVLSWPAEERAAVVDGDRPDLPGGHERSGEMPQELGDIAIAFDTCAREAREQGKSMADHVAHLLVHGVLHLLGYDHIRPGDAGLMEATEIRILAGLGIADPYA
jgi:probable rRNA maturation factor